MEICIGLFIAATGLTALCCWVLFLFRKKYAETLLSVPEERQKQILESSLKIVQIFRILFWLSPIYLILVPLAISFLSRSLSVYMAVEMALLYLGVLPVFLSRKLLIRHFDPKLDSTFRFADLLQVAKKKIADVQKSIEGSEWKK
jgi:hypothetical protein